MPDLHTRRLITDSPSASRVCLQCGERRPVTDFRKRGRKSHQRHRECGSCHSENERFRRRVKKERDAEAFLSERLATLRHKRTLNQRLALIDEMNQRLGGPERVAKLFHQQLNRVATEQRPGTVCRMLGQFLTLASAVAQQKDDTVHNSLMETLGGAVSAIDNAADA
jgi:hypothetical protein